MLCAANASKSGAAVVDKVCRLCSADKYALLHLSLSSSSSSKPEVEI